MKTLYFTLLISVISAIGAYDYTTSYTMTDDYAIHFSTGRAEGSLSGLKGTVNFSESDLDNSYMDVTVAVATINTGNTTKDNHAKKSKWFDAETYPLIGFKSNAIKALTDGNYQATGILTMKGLRKQVVIDFTTDTETNYLTGSTIVNREDFNIKGNGFSFIVGKDV